MNTVRAARRDDAEAVAELHSARLSAGFLATLGRRFLRRLYGRMTRSPHAFLLVTEDDRGVNGFIAVALDTRRFYREFVVRDGLGAVLAAAPALLRAPNRVWETLRYGATSGADDLPPAEVLAIAVARRTEGEGVGSTLLAGALHELLTRRVDAACVVTAIDNVAALRMYERAGFRRKRRVEVHAGVEQEVLVWR